MMPPLAAGDSVVVLGLGLYGRAVVEALRTRGVAVAAVEDRPDDDTRRFADDWGARLIEAPDGPDLEALFRGGPTAFVPSPGVPERHAAFTIAEAHGIPRISEFDMARWWDDRPIGAITGTDGKTTVTLLTVDMLDASGVRAAAVGNNDTPLITALTDPDIDVFVVEASSFRLGHTEQFRPAVAAWLNFGPDHLDVHRDLEAYENAKASIWASLPPDGVAVAVDTDAVVMSHLPLDRRVVTVGSARADGHVEGDRLILHGRVIARVDELQRSFAHDITNTLVAAAVALELGASAEGIREAISSQELLPHRIQYVATIGGIAYYNDSKATVPHAVVTALRSFDRVVLIAGGRNKGLDLGELESAIDHIDAVVAIGEAADEIVEAVGHAVPVVRATDMAAAVASAGDLAESAGVVLLSPGCASYDAYTSYVARGDHFIDLVRSLEAEGAGPQ